MDRAFASMLTVSALLCTSTAAPVPREDQRPAFYCPIKVGAKLAYQRGDQERTETVTEVKEKDGEVMVTFDIQEGGKSRTAEVMLSRKGMFVVQRRERGRIDFEPLLQLPVCPGDYWSYGTENDQISTVSTVVGVEVIDVPAGTYRAVRVDSKVRFIHETRSGRTTNTGTMSIWYALGVGCVKSTWRIDAMGGVAEQTWVLKSFEPSPGKNTVPRKK